MRRLAFLLPALLVAAAFAACGDDEKEAGAPFGGTELRVEVTEAASQPIRMTLRCGADCDVAALREALKKENPELACTQQYGGPERAHVTGTLDGRPVDVVLDRADGCGIAAYDALFSAFGRTPPLAG
jgi:hypothetical protein